MKVIESVAEMQTDAESLRMEGKTVGLVPTMGFLHDGHISLIQKAREYCERLVVSIFVNPVQFGPTEDFDRYPRDFERDSRLLQTHGVDIVFHPDSLQMYPEKQKTYVITENLSEKLCGISRPGHFRGVTTVVAKLFNIIRPHVAVFGQKDAQQALILKKMVKDLNYNIRMVIAPTVREPDGLAMSSRNQYLSASERQTAPVIYRTLSNAQDMIRQGQRSGEKIGRFIRDTLDGTPHLRVDYVSLVDQENLDPVVEIVSGTLIATAVYCGTTRLIDNIIVI
jgi:pantoate--beta-alanine ligase